MTTPPLYGPVWQRERATRPDLWPVFLPPPDEDPASPDGADT